jgi:hypothetical protein
MKRRVYKRTPVQKIAAGNSKPQDFKLEKSPFLFRTYPCSKKDDTPWHKIVTK